MEERHLTSRSFGVFLISGSFNKQLSTKLSASGGNLPSGVNLGAGSLTICCNSSKMLIVIPPPCRLTPLLFLLSFFALSFRDLGKDNAAIDPIEPGRAGDRVLSKSDRSESSDSDSENGKRPKASSMREMPSDHTSDLTVYCAP